MVSDAVVSVATGIGPGHTSANSAAPIILATPAGMISQTNFDTKRLTLGFNHVIASPCTHA